DCISHLAVVPSAESLPIRTHQSPVAAMHASTAMKRSRFLRVRLTAELYAEVGMGFHRLDKGRGRSEDRPACMGGRPNIIRRRRHRGPSHHAAAELATAGKVNPNEEATA